MNKNNAILNGFIKKDEKVIKQFYKDNIPNIRKYILANSGTETDVEDIFQDALVLIYTKTTNQSLSITQTIRSYFYGVCKNMWYNKLRENIKKRTHYSIIDIEDQHPTIIQTIEQIEKEHLYRSYFYKLHQSSQKILTLFFEGKNIKEIANITGYTEGYVRKKKFEAKKSLITMIEKDPIHHELKTVSKKEASTNQQSKIPLAG